MSDRYDIVIVGSGVAGASTAYFLKNKYSVDNLVVVEKEETPYSHASGLNAGIVRQLVETMPIVELAKKSVDFFKNPPQDFCKENFYFKNGGILTEKDETDNRISTFMKFTSKLGIPYEEIERREVLNKIPFLDEAPFVRAVYGRDDGVLDINNLLSSYLKGVEIRTSSEVKNFKVEEGKIKKLIFDGKEETECDVVVMATGAYSEGIARKLGLNHIYLDPRRRHLLISTEIEGLKNDFPYYWSMNPQFYFRYESGGLLFSPCDEIVMPPEELKASGESLSWLYERLKIGAPKLTSIQIKRFWAELRTFSFDNNFLIGFDPLIKNLFWVTALQGHGMTCSSAVGETSADLICGYKPDIDSTPHLPARLSH